MKKIINLLALIFAVNIVFSQVDFKQGTVAEILAMAKQQNKPVMVDVMTDWCVWCIELDNLVYVRQEIYEYANNNQINYKIDAEKGEGVEFAKKYKVNGYPAILFLDGDGVEIDRINGYFPVAQFKRFMEDYSKGINTTKDLEAKLKTEPDNIEVNYKSGEKKMYSEKQAEAKNHFQKIIDLDPDNKSGRKDDAEFLIADMSDKDNIAKNLEAFIINNPSSDVLKDAYVEIVFTYINTLNNIPGAEKWVNEALSKYPDDEAVRIVYSRYLNAGARTIAKDSTSREDDYKNALSILEKSLTYSKNSTAAAQAYYWQSVLYFNLKDYQKSMESINNAIGIFNHKTYREQKAKV
ncbi:MAG TPA: thioredoxin fold domain-containing protein, partial [Ignavibacteria bacterium]|nr:thioredoxin fold domain-containing protein [Ignavibacteria bacterium]